jgi:hypothetical protein
MTNASSRQVGGDHYKGATIQHWDLITDHLGPFFLVGNATKYLSRWQKKNGVEDLEKALHYTEKLIEHYTEVFAEWPGERFERKDTSRRLYRFCAESGVSFKTAAAICCILQATNVSDLEEAARYIREILDEQVADADVPTGEQLATTEHDGAARLEERRQGRD